MNAHIRTAVEAILVGAALGLGAAVGCSSPDEGCDKGYKPSGCRENEPPTGVLRITVTISGMNPRIPVTVYYGTVDANVVAFVDTLDQATREYSMPNRDYAVKAKYAAIIDHAPATVYSIEGGSLSPDHTEYCDGTCYAEGTLELDATYP